MKLHKVPEYQDKRIRILGDEKEPPSHRKLEVGEELIFSHIDGMYSYCHDLEGNVVHLVAWADVEVVE